MREKFKNALMGTPVVELFVKTKTIDEFDYYGDYIEIPKQQIWKLFNENNYVPKNWGVNEETGFLWIDPEDS